MPRVYAMMVRQGLHHLIQGLCSAFLHCRVCFAVSKKKKKQQQQQQQQKRVMVRRGLHHLLTQYKGFMF